MQLKLLLEKYGYEISYPLLNRNIHEYDRP